MSRAIVNLNGTSRQDLILQNHEAAKALREAKEVVLQTAPHGRDYQLNRSPNDYTKDREEFAERITLINTMIAYYEAIAERLALER
jgi:acyl-CoA reductase-like NAD-dependent aldehyde dehydrogenase